MIDPALVLDLVSDAIIVVDQTLTIQLWNSAAERIYGWPASSALGSPLGDILPLAGGLDQAVGGHPARGDPWRGELLQPHRDGRLLTIASAVHTLYSRESPVALVMINRDLSEQRRLEQERDSAQDQLERYAERMQSLATHLVELQERERAHLARELHDEIGQLLTGLSLALTIGPRAGPELVRERLADAQQQINALTAQIRTLSLDLRPAMLDDLGLLPAVLWYVRRYSERTRVEVTVQHSGLEGRLGPAIEISAYRIIQEGLTNIARHAGTSRATLQIWLMDDLLQIQIEDHGRGFDLAGLAADYRSSGLLGMRERAGLVGGGLIIDSEPGRGTRLLASLPLQPIRPREEPAP